MLFTSVFFALGQFFTGNVSSSLFVLPSPPSFQRPVLLLITSVSSILHPITVKTFKSYTSSHRKKKKNMRKGRTDLHQNDLSISSSISFNFSIPPFVSISFIQSYMVFSDTVRERPTTDPDMVSHSTINVLYMV